VVATDGALMEETRGAVLSTITGVLGPAALLARFSLSTAVPARMPTAIVPLPLRPVRTTCL